MAELFQDKYRISSTRLSSWDYGSPGMYFVTICTAGKECYFGEISDAREGDACNASLQMHYSAIGEYAKAEWLETVEKRTDMNIELGEFQVMPNHFHAILLIGENQYNYQGKKTEINNHLIHEADADKPLGKFAPQSKNLPAVIRGYKGAVSSFARKNNIEFAWQARYHEHIIRSAKEYQLISDYIRNNVAKWHEDRFYHL